MNRTISILVMAGLLLPLLSTGMVGYRAYGLVYTPSFGGGVYHYADGLVINGKIFDISGYSQKIPTQNMTIGMPSNVTLKIFDNAGSYSIRTVSLFLNSRGQSSSVANSDTWIQYALSGKTVIEDPHHFIGTAKGSVAYSGMFAIVSFEIIPSSKMTSSNLIVSSTDSRLSTGYSMIVDAVSFANKTQGGSTTNVDYIHQHCTATHPCEPVCGDHVCKPGERPSPKP